MRSTTDDSVCMLHTRAAFRSDIALHLNITHAVLLNDLYRVYADQQDNIQIDL